MRIANTSDDELFAGGICVGTFFICGGMQEGGEVDIEQLKTRIEQSLEAARSELTPADRIIVSDLWQLLQSQVVA